MKNSQYNFPPQTQPNLLTAFFTNAILRDAPVALSRTVIAPLERTHLLRQTQQTLVDEGRLAVGYSSDCDCFDQIVDKGGYKALWRGNLTRIAVDFFNNHVLGSYLNKILLPFSQTISLHSAFASYANLLKYVGLQTAMSAFAFVFTCPTTYGQLRLICDTEVNGSYRYNNLYDVCTKTLEKEGVLGFYKGYIFSVLGSGVNKLGHLLCYVFLMKHLLSDQVSKNPMLIHSLSQWISLTLGTVLGYPFYTVYRRFALSDKSESWVDSLAAIWNEGLPSLYRGFPAYLLASQLEYGLGSVFARGIYSLVINVMPSAKATL